MIEDLKRIHSAQPKGKEQQSEAEKQQELLVENAIEELKPSAILDEIKREVLKGKGAIVTDPSNGHREFRLNWKVGSNSRGFFGRGISIIFSPSLKANQSLMESLELSQEWFAGIVISGGRSPNLKRIDWETGINGGVLKLHEPIEELIPAFVKAIAEAFKKSFWWEQREPSDWSLN